MIEEIIELARELGDESGEDAETVKLISRVLELPVEQVNHVLMELASA